MLLKSSNERFSPLLPRSLPSRFPSNTYSARHRTVKVVPSHRELTVFNQVEVDPWNVGLSFPFLSPTK